jgi:hypothetical protein
VKASLPPKPIKALGEQAIFFDDSDFISFTLIHTSIVSAKLLRLIFLVKPKSLDGL